MVGRFQNHFSKNILKILNVVVNTVIRYVNSLRSLGYLLLISICMIMDPNFVPDMAWAVPLSALP